ncbi:hypothetical protein C0Q70_04219 [Pomacea canaliculata]|uniref:Uncharacterized protein n=1 Tax=Pomacea canaliculata TaxID=400727 RepID=A0A2T7PUW9_POMCA|nr:hypothetical protein C0Q70_04219 [Pomacea canaliculata]
MVYQNSNVHRSGRKYLSPALVSDPTFTQTVDPNSPSLPCCSQRVPTTLRCPPAVEEGKMSGKSSVSHCAEPYTLNVSTKLKLTLQQQHVSTDGVIRPRDCMMKETFSWVLSSSCHPTVWRAINYPLGLRRSAQVSTQQGGRPTAEKRKAHNTSSSTREDNLTEPSKEKRSEKKNAYESLFYDRPTYEHHCQHRHDSRRRAVTDITNQPATASIT